MSSPSAKLSVAIREEEVLKNLWMMYPIVWPKLHRTSRLFKWRLDEWHKKQGGNFTALVQEAWPNLRGHEEQMAWAALEPPHVSYIYLVSLLVRHNFAKILKSRGEQGFTMLQKSVAVRSPTLVKFLICEGHSLNAKGAYGYTPLHEACYNGFEEVVRCLLEYKANVDALSKNGSTALLVAAREGHTKVVEALLEAKAHPEDGGDKGWTPLSVAAGENCVEVCVTLLNYKAHVQGFVGEDGFNERSSLMEAAEQGHEAVVELLLYAKADPCHKVYMADLDGNTFPMTARTAALAADKSRHTRIPALLQEAEAQMRAVQDSGEP